MRPRKLTAQQIERIRAVVVARSALPTNAELAAEFDCSKRLVDTFTAGRNYRAKPRVNATMLHECLVELGLAKP